MGQLPLCWVPTWGGLTAVFGLIFKTLGERALSPLLGFSRVPSVGLKCVLVGLWCQAILVKTFRVRSIRKLISSFPTVNFTWGSYGELGASSPGEPLGLFIQGVPLFLTMRGSHLLLFFFCFILEQSVFQCPPPSSKHIIPSPVVAYLSSSNSPSRNPVPLPKKWCFILYLLSSVVVPCWVL